MPLWKKDCYLLTRQDIKWNDWAVIKALEGYSCQFPTRHYWHPPNSGYLQAAEPCLCRSTLPSKIYFLLQSCAALWVFVAVYGAWGHCKYLRTSVWPVKHPWHASQRSLNMIVAKNVRVKIVIESYRRRSRSENKAKRCWCCKYHNW